MEYILFLTYRCNLNCAYCFAKNYVQSESLHNCTLSQEMANRICKYIETDISTNNRKDNSIVFFGGEPTLVPEIISLIMSNTEHLQTRYSIYTNGLLLEQMPADILGRLQTILVAIDGDIECHEHYKPKGSYERIVQQVSNIRKKTNAQLIARITMEEETNIDLSVSNLLPHFDYVHWQIVNKESFNNSALLLENYKNNVGSLFNKWLQFLREGIVLNIVPFNRIVHSMLTKDYSHSFRCGCGNSTQAIDVNGNIYLCDEYIEDPESSVGNISEGRHNCITYKSHYDIFPACRTCDVSEICKGRCRKCLETRSVSQIQNYCNLTKILLYMIRDSISEITDCLMKHNIPLAALAKEIYKTEIIP